MKIVLAGVPGGGKSTIIQLVRKQMPKFKEAVFGDYMFEIAKKKYGIIDRDVMRKKLSIEDYRVLQETAAKTISRIGGDVIINTHTSVRYDSGFYPGLASNVLKLLKPEIIVLLNYRPEDVLKRRNKDLQTKGKEKTQIGTFCYRREYRDVEPPEFIKLHQEMNRLFAVTAANEARCSLKFIDLTYPEKKEFEHANRAAREIIKLIEEQNLKR